MNILILGGSGMIGSCLLRHLNHRNEVFATFRTNPSTYPQLERYHDQKVFFNIDARDLTKITDIVQKTNSDVVINAIGITKQLISENEKQDLVYINSSFPHQLYDICNKFDTRLIQLSSDCVFSGEKGFYSENDIPDAHDLYGISKIDGEIEKPNALTIRKSTIGLESGPSHGLIEWFLKSKGTIRGYRNAIYSGLTTIEFSKVIDMIINDHQDLTGIWNISSAPISKFDLLIRLSDFLERNDINIIPYDDFFCDRSLDQRAFSERTGYSAPSWDRMLKELANKILERDSLNKNL